MGLRDTLFRWVSGEPEQRGGAILPLAFQDFVNYFSFNNNIYQTVHQTLGGQQESMDSGFEGVVQGAYRDNGVVFACELARLMVFSEARFQFRQMRQGRPGDLFGTADLAILETPWPNGTTGDLLTKMLQHADIAGNAYVIRRGQRLKILRPDWVSIVYGVFGGDKDSWQDIDADLLGYLYHPGGRYSGKDAVALLAEQVCHFAPIPDPVANYRGMSWITPVLREIMADKAATSHKLKFFENGATPNMVVKTGLDDPEKFNSWVDRFKAAHESVANAYKTLFLAAGADATVVGANFQQMDFKVTQGAGETRIAAAAGVPPAVVGLSEGLQGSSLNAGNYTASRRRFADGTMRPLWRNVAGSLATLVPAPGGSALWYDDRDISFLQEDVKDTAEIQQMNASAMKQLLDAGFEPKSVVNAITADDWERLVHTGLYSVQLQPPGTSLQPAVPVVPVPPVGAQLNSEMLLALTRNLDRDPTVPQINVTSPPVTIESGAVQVPITFPEGFVRSETTVEPAQVTIEKGAVQVDSPVTIEPTQVTIEDGAIRSDTPVTVHTPEVRIEEGAVRVDSPVTVEQPEITVQPAEVRIEQPKARTVRKDVTHDDKGRITRIVETEEE